MNGLQHRKGVPCLLNVLQAVFPSTSSAWAATDANSDSSRVVVHGIEVTVRRQVGPPFSVQAGYKRDGPGYHCADDEWIDVRFPYAMGVNSNHFAHVKGRILWLPWLPAWMRLAHKYRLRAVSFGMSTAEERACSCSTQPSPDQHLYQC
jgi:hypothetical protein